MGTYNNGRYSAEDEAFEADDVVGAASFDHSDLQDSLGKVKTSVSGLAHSIVDAGRHQVDRARDSVSLRMDRAADAIRREPWKAVGGALVLGLLLGRAMRT